MLTQSYHTQESFSWGCSCLLPALGPSCAGGADTTQPKSPGKARILSPGPCNWRTTASMALPAGEDLEKTHMAVGHPGEVIGDRALRLHWRYVVSLGNQVGSLAKSVVP